MLGGLGTEGVKQVNDGDMGQKVMFDGAVVEQRADLKAGCRPPAQWWGVDFWISG